MIYLTKIIEECEIEKFIEGLELDPNFVINTDKNIKIFPFEIGEKKYEVRADIKMTVDKKTIGEFKFYLMNNPKFPKAKDFQNDTQYQIASQKSRVGITGTGDNFSILTKVINIISKYSENNKLDYITFTADEENRQDLYKKILTRLVKKYNIPYKELTNNPLDGSSLSKEEFWMQRADT